MFRLLGFAPIDAINPLHHDGVAARYLPLAANSARNLLHLVIGITGSLVSSRSARPDTRSTWRRESSRWFWAIHARAGRSDRFGSHWPPFGPATSLPLTWPGFVSPA